MAQEFTCKQSGCPEQVYYESDDVIAFRLPESERAARVSGKKIVYLTCLKDHTHPYEVEG